MQCLRVQEHELARQRRPTFGVGNLITPGHLRSAARRGVGKRRLGTDQEDVPALCERLIARVAA